MSAENANEFTSLDTLEPTPSRWVNCPMRIPSLETAVRFTARHMREAMIILAGITIVVLLSVNIPRLDSELSPTSIYDGPRISIGNAGSPPPRFVIEIPPELKNPLTNVVVVDPRSLSFGGDSKLAAAQVVAEDAVDEVGSNTQSAGGASHDENAAEINEESGNASASDQFVPMPVEIALGDPLGLGGGTEVNAGGAVDATVEDPGNAVANNAIGYYDVLHYAETDEDVAAVLSWNVKFLAGNAPQGVTFTYGQIVEAMGVVAEPVPDGVLVAKNLFGQEWELPDGTVSIHKGIDIGHGKEKPPVHSASDGKVAWGGEGYLWYGDENAFGPQPILIETNSRIVIDGEVFAIVFLYGHMNEHDIKIGDKVTAGMYLGPLGAQGNAAGEHLHWEARAVRLSGIDADIREAMIIDESGERPIALWKSDVSYPLDLAPLFNLFDHVMKMKNIPVVAEPIENVQLIPVDVEQVSVDASMQDIVVIKRFSGTLSRGGVNIVEEIGVPVVVVGEPFSDGFTPLEMYIPDGLSALEVNAGNGVTCRMTLPSGVINSNCSVNNFYGFYPNDQQLIAITTVDQQGQSTTYNYTFSRN